MPYKRQHQFRDPDEAREYLQAVHAELLRDLFPRNHHYRLNGDETQESDVYGSHAVYRLSTYYDQAGTVRHALFPGVPVVEIDEPEASDSG